MLRQIIGCFLLGVTTDFTNQNDALGFWILQEYFEAVNEVSSVEGVTTDANAQSLTQVGLKVFDLLLQLVRWQTINRRLVIIWRLQLIH